MPGLQLSFTKVVFPPTSFAAVHTYTAGSFFAVIAVHSATTDHDVHMIGKELFSQLETDFFSLEEKNLVTIKAAIAQLLSQLPEDIHISLSATYIKDSVAYVFGCGGGSIILKRGDKVGHILTSQGKELKAASGHIQSEDLLFLQTTDFAQHISLQTLQGMSDRLPNEIADTLTTKLQTIENSGAASIILKVEGLLQSAVYSPIHQEPVPEESVVPSIPQEEQPEPEPLLAPTTYAAPMHPSYEEIEEPVSTKPYRSLPKFKFAVPRIPLSFLRRFHLRTKTIVGLVVAAVVIIMLVISILYIQRHQQAVHDEQVFHKYYDEAKKQYDSGNAISAVNSNATSSKVAYQKAQDLLKTAKSQLPADATQTQQVNDLLTQVESKLQQSANIQTVQVSSAQANDTPLLATEQKQNVQYVSRDDKTIYYITGTGVFQSDKTAAVLKNDTDWKQVGGFAAYSGNLYILDKSASIIKFIGGSSGYGKAAYFQKDTSPNVSRVVSMSIDSSVYLLLSDGTISKYTKGEPDSFIIKNLDKPLASPTRIFTNADATGVYVLDNGNGRIVQFGKDGTFEKQYVADQIAKATDIDVQEGNKKIYFLSSDGIHSINL